MRRILAILFVLCPLILVAAWRLPSPHNARLGEALWMPCEDNSASAIVDDIGPGNLNRPFLSGYSPSATSLHAVAGKVDGALAFDGVDDCIELAAGATGGNANARWMEEITAPNRDFSIALWLQPRWRNQPQFFFDWFAYHSVSGGGICSFDCRTYGTRSTVLSTQVYAMGDYVGGSDIATSATWSDVWFHVAAVRSGTTFSVYRNATLLQSQQATKYAGQWYSCESQVDDIELGSAYGPGWFGTCAIDDVRVYPRALSASELQALYDAGAGRATPLPR